MFELHGNLRDALGQPLARPQVKGNVMPAPVIDIRPQGGEGFRGGVRTDAVFCPVTGDDFVIDGSTRVLAPDGGFIDLLAFGKTERGQDFRFFIPDGIRIERTGRLHRYERKQLKKMVLKHVPQGAGLFIVPRAVFNAHGFGGGNLHMINVFPVPDRLIDGVSEAEHQNILNGLFPQIVVDAVDLIFAEDAGFSKESELCLERN